MNRDELLDQLLVERHLPVPGRPDEQLTRNVDGLQLLSDPPAVIARRRRELLAATAGWTLDQPQETR